MASPAECKQFFNAHFADAPPPPERERCFEGWGGWQCTNETYFLPKHRNLFRKKGGFPGRIIMFWPKLFGFLCFGKLFFVWKWPKCRNSETENETVRTLEGGVGRRWKEWNGGGGEGVLLLSVWWIQLRFSQTGVTITKFPITITITSKMSGFFERKITLNDRQNE